MKNFIVFTLILLLFSCNSQLSREKLEQHNQDLLVVTDSISQLMSEFHYNPAELTADSYLEIEQGVRNLAKSVKTNQDFIKGFNELWQEGPFSHVRLGVQENSAAAMADYIDTLNVGGGGVSLVWDKKIAVLTISTMMGIDTKEQIFKAYKEIASNNTESLIIDLRNNTGGTFAGVPLVGHLTANFIDAGTFVSRKWWNNNTRIPVVADIQNLKPWEGWSIKSFWHDVQEDALTRVTFAPMKPQFVGPVYVLISNKTASAAEFTTDALAQIDNVTIIGETTAGEMLSQKMFDLPYGLQLSLPIAEYYSLRSGRIEGKGVKPDIAINQSVAMDVAIDLILGESPTDAMANAKIKLDKMNSEPLKDAPIYLLGSMNNWGENVNATPRFEYKGEGIYSTTITLKKGKYEFKIAPLDWEFDFGANPSQEVVIPGKKVTVSSVSGGDNLLIYIKEESKFSFSIDVSNKELVTLSVLKTN